MLCDCGVLLDWFGIVLGFCVYVKLFYCCLLFAGCGCVWCLGCLCGASFRCAVCLAGLFVDCTVCGCFVVVVGWLDVRLGL